MRSVTVCRGSEENSEPSKQKKSVWGALVSSDDLEEEEQEEAPKKALGEDVDLVPPIEMEELTRQQMKDRAEPMINVSLSSLLFCFFSMGYLHCNIGHIVLFDSYVVFMPMP